MAQGEQFLSCRSIVTWRHLRVLRLREPLGLRIQRIINWRQFDC